MKSLNIVNFFKKHLGAKDFFKIFFSFFLNFFVIFFEIIFITLIFLFLNSETKTENNNFLIDFLINFIQKLSFQYDLSVIQGIVLLITFSLIIKNLMLIFNNWFLSNFIYNLSAKKNTEVFSNYLRKNYLDFIKNDISYYSKNINKEVYHVFSGVLQSLVQILNDILYVILIISFSFKLISIPISFFHFVILFILIILIFLIFKKTKEIGKIRFVKETNVFKNVNDFFSSIKEIKIYGAYNALILNFKKSIKKYYQTFILGSVLSVTPKLLLEIFVLIAFFISFFNSGQTVENFIPSIAVIVVLVLRILPPIYRSIANYSSIIFYQSSVNEIDKSYISRTNVYSNSRKLKKRIHKIEFKNVSFSFKDNKKKSLIKNFNYTFEKGKIYGLVGESGSGKSTFLSIISGLIKPKYGKIIINNKKISNKDIFLDFDIGILSQNPFILNESILTNITLK